MTKETMRILDATPAVGDVISGQTPTPTACLPWLRDHQAGGDWRIAWLRCTHAWPRLVDVLGEPLRVDVIQSPDLRAIHAEVGLPETAGAPSAIDGYASTLLSRCAGADLREMAGRAALALGGDEAMLCRCWTVSGVWIVGVNHDGTRASVELFEPAQAVAEVR